MEKIIKLSVKYSEIIKYLIFGVLTTIVNFIVYVICTDVIKIADFDKYQYLFANVISWIVAVIFAYITNKKFVFRDNQKGKQIKKFLMFSGTRVLSLIADMVIILVLVELVHINDLISKIISSVIVVILNYMFSKVIIFRKKEKNEKN